MSTTLKTLRLYTRQYAKHPWLFIGSLGLGVGAVLQTVVAPLFIAKIVGQLANQHPISTAYVLLAAGFLIGGAIIAYVADRFASMPLARISRYELAELCLDKLIVQDYSFFADNFSGSLVTQANRFSRGYEIFSNTFFLELLGVWLSVLTALVIMTYINPWLGISVAILWAISISVVVLLVLRRMPYRRYAVEKESQMTGELADILTNTTAVKTFAAETYEISRYGRTNFELSTRLARSWKLAINNQYILQMLCIALQLIVLIGGIASVRHGSLTIATFLLFQVYILRIIDSINKAASEMRQFEGVFGDAAEMTELLDRTPEVLDPAKPEPSRINKGEIEFNAVEFKYNEHADDIPDLLHKFGMRIKPGEKVGLVGPSGGGKTTITKLLLRFMDVQGGSITIDGQEIRAITQDDLHAAISYVPQEPLLFHRSIHENISYGLRDASDAAITNAAKKSHAHDFIKDLPNGYDTLVGERGIKLSGGQRQRIAIARAMLKKSPILLLDEATSALDSESESYIQSSLWNLMKGKTTLVIAHRLSTIQRLDRIIVLDKGKIIEEGTHKQLLKRDELYARLWAHQSGGFIED